MSDSGSLPQIIKPSDMTLLNKQALDAFVTEGLPGIARATESSVFQWFNLYLAGKTYDQIADICSADVRHILYIANKFGWFEKKMSHYNGILTKLDQRVQASKLESAEFVLDVIAFIHKKHGTKITEYIRTGDTELLKSIHLGELDKYFKSIDALGKLLSKPPEMPAIPTQPGVHIHLGDSKIERKEDGSIEITSTSSLKDIANQKRLKNNKES
jgi:hypothetical protein